MGEGTWPQVEPNVIRGRSPQLSGNAVASLRFTLVWKGSLAACLWLVLAFFFAPLGATCHLLVIYPELQGQGLGASPFVQGREHWRVEGKQGEVFFLAPGSAPGGMKDVKIVCLVIAFPVQPLIISLSVEGTDSVNAEAFCLLNC